MPDLSPLAKSLVTAVGFLTDAYDLFILNIGEPCRSAAWYCGARSPATVSQRSGNWQQPQEARCRAALPHDPDRTLTWEVLCARGRRSK